MFVKVLVIVALVLCVTTVAVTLLGAARWQSSTRSLHARLDAGRSTVVPAAFFVEQLDGLPAPVQRYLLEVLPAGQPLVAAAYVRHTGSFNMAQDGEWWRSFTSTQRVVTNLPGFVWDARIRLAPGINVNVHDAYVVGQGVLNARLFGLFTVMRQAPTPELAEGELMRFLAEAAWYPTVLIPGPGIEWEGVDDSMARVTLTDGATSVTLTVQFDDRGLIASVRSDGRYRDVDGVPVWTPWQGRFWDYVRRDGMLVPLEGEVVWLLPGGPQPYWRGRIASLTYEFVG